MVPPNSTTRRRGFYLEKKTRLVCVEAKPAAVSKVKGVPMVSVATGFTPVFTMRP